MEGLTTIEVGGQVVEVAADHPLAVQPQAPDAPATQDAATDTAAVASEGFGFVSNETDSDAGEDSEDSGGEEDEAAGTAPALSPQETPSPQQTNPKREQWLELGRRATQGDGRQWVNIPAAKRHVIAQELGQDAVASFLNWEERRLNPEDAQMQTQQAIQQAQALERMRYEEQLRRQEIFERFSEVQDDAYALKEAVENDPDGFTEYLQLRRAQEDLSNPDKVARLQQTGNIYAHAYAYVQQFPHLAKAFEPRPENLGRYERTDAGLTQAVFDMMDAYTTERIKQEIPARAEELVKQRMPEIVKQIRRQVAAEMRQNRAPATDDGAPSRGGATLTEAQMRDPVFWKSQSPDAIQKWIEAGAPGYVARQAGT